MWLRALRRTSSSLIDAERDLDEHPAGTVGLAAAVLDDEAAPGEGREDAMRGGWRHVQFGSDVSDAKFAALVEKQQQLQRVVD